MIKAQNALLGVLCSYLHSLRSRFGRFRRFEGIITRVGARPAAARLIETVAGQPARTAVRNDAGRLFGQKGRRVDNLSFQGDVFICSITI